LLMVYPTQATGKSDVFARRERRRPNETATKDGVGPGETGETERNATERSKAFTPGAPQ